MRLLLDANLSPRVGTQLTEAGHDAPTSRISGCWLPTTERSCSAPRMTAMCSSPPTPTSRCWSRCGAPRVRPSSCCAASRSYLHASTPSSSSPTCLPWPKISVEAPSSPSRPVGSACGTCRSTETRLGHTWATRGRQPTRNVGRRPELMSDARNPNTAGEQRDFDGRARPHHVPATRPKPPGPASRGGHAGSNPVGAATAKPLLRRGLRPVRERRRAGPHGCALSPARYTKFVGRTGEVEALRGLVTENRLTTITGPGGVGKSSWQSR